MHQDLFLILPMFGIDSLIARSSSSSINMAQHFTILRSPRLSFLSQEFHGEDQNISFLQNLIDRHSWIEIRTVTKNDAVAFLRPLCAGDAWFVKFANLWHEHWTRQFLLPPRPGMMENNFCFKQSYLRIGVEWPRQPKWVSNQRLYFKPHVCANHSLQRFRKRGETLGTYLPLGALKVCNKPLYILCYIYTIYKGYIAQTALLIYILGQHYMESM